MDNPRQYFEDKLDQDGKDLFMKMRQDNEEARQRKISLIGEWMERSPYYSVHLINLMAGLRTRTFGATQADDKAALCCDLGDQLEAKGIIKHPLVYLASSDDFAFALCLRFREIYLVDPEFTHESLYDELRKIFGIVFEGTEQLRPDSGKTFRGMVNFGSSRDKVTIHCIPSSAQEFVLPEDVVLGGVISYQNGGNAHPFLFPDLCKRIVAGGVIYDNGQSFLEVPIYQEIYKAKGSYDPLTEEEQEMAHRKIWEAALTYGLDAVFPFTGYRSPYYRVNQPLTEEFMQKMHAAINAKNEENRKLAEVLGYLRAVPNLNQQ